ncbi:hypothetical protein D0383_10745 [Staphylococcus epidermidis]|nr:hypothetical protein [Staphylococcus epidermidis]MBM0817175.1 hypothetical protein [Staphylococcus epidermidis]
MYRSSKQHNIAFHFLEILTFDTQQLQNLLILNLLEIKKALNNIIQS